MKHLKKDFVAHKGNDYKPHFLRHQSVLIFLLLIVVVELGFLVQVFIVFDKTKFLASILPGVLTILTNEERAKNDVPPLVPNELLARAAQLKAEDMAAKGYFAHTSPEGITPWYWFNQVGYKYTYAGENLAVNFFESEDLSRAWMNSPTHRANIVKKEFTEIGIGVANGVYQGRNTVFVAEFFGKPNTLAFVPIAETPSPIIPKEAPVKTPTPATPKPTTPTTSPQVAVTPLPTATSILGEEVDSPGSVVIASAAPKSSLAKIFIQKILSSPRQSVNYLYGSIALLAVLTLLLLFIKAEIKHPIIIARGAALIGVIVLLSVINLRGLNLETKVPEGGLNASAIEALAR